MQICSVIWSRLGSQSKEKTKTTMKVLFYLQRNNATLLAHNRVMANV